MKSILEAIENNADTKAFEALQIPESYRAAVVRKDEQEMFAGVASADKDPRKSVHIPFPKLRQTKHLLLSWPAASTSTRCGAAFSNQFPPLVRSHA